MVKIFYTYYSYKLFALFTRVRLQQKLVITTKSGLMQHNLLLPALTEFKSVYVALWVMNFPP